MNNHIEISIDLPRGTYEVLKSIKKETDELYFRLSTNHRTLYLSTDIDDLPNYPIFSDDDLIL